MTAMMDLPVEEMMGVVVEIELINLPRGLRPTKYQAGRISAWSIALRHTIYWQQGNIDEVILHF